MNLRSLALATSALLVFSGCARVHTFLEGDERPRRSVPARDAAYQPYAPPPAAASPASYDYPVAVARENPYGAPDYEYSEDDVCVPPCPGEPGGPPIVMPASSRSAPRHAPRSLAPALAPASDPYAVPPVAAPAESDYEPIDEAPTYEPPSHLDEADAPETALAQAAPMIQAPGRAVQAIAVSSVDAAYAPHPDSVPATSLSNGSTVYSPPPARPEPIAPPRAVPAVQTSPAPRPAPPVVRKPPQLPPRVAPTPKKPEPKPVVDAAPLELETIFFPSGVKEPNADIRKVLDRNAALLKAKPQWNIVVEGHADSVGSAEANYAVSLDRAIACARYLIAAGVDGRRIEVVSYGEDRPAVAGNSASARSKNRRVQFLLYLPDETDNSPAE